MGQQQLLLIILGVIIVGIAVAVGINMFTASAAAANRDAVASDLQNLGAMAQQYYRRPQSLGGGNNSFDGSTVAGGVAWAIPGQLAANANGFYAVTAISASSVTIVGRGMETGTDPAAANATGGTPALPGGTGFVQITTTVLATSISSVVNN